MPHDNLKLYVNDHLAGSVAALALFDRLCSRVDDPAMSQELDHLRQAVGDDQDTLRDLMRRLEISESRRRKLGALVGQKLTNLKLRLSRSKHGEVQLLHSLDALSAGVAGKKALWTSLAAVADTDERLRSPPYERLIERADDQLARLAGLRTRVASYALRGGAG